MKPTKKFLKWYKVYGVGDDGWVQRDSMAVWYAMSRVAWRAYQHGREDGSDALKKDNERLKKQLHEYSRKMIDCADELISACESRDSEACPLRDCKK